MSILQHYLKVTGLTQREFAAKIGVDQSIVSRLTKSKGETGMKPSLALAIKIERATQGSVPAASWVEDTVEKAT